MLTTKQSHNRLFSSSCYKLSKHFIAYYSIYLLQFIALVIIDIELLVLNGGKLSKLRGKSARGRTRQETNKPGGERVRGWIIQGKGVNQPGGERAMEWTSQEANQPGTWGESARGHNSHEAKWQRGKNTVPSLFSTH